MLLRIVLSHFDHHYLLLPLHSELRDLYRSVLENYLGFRWDKVINENYIPRDRRILKSIPDIGELCEFPIICTSCPPLDRGLLIKNYFWVAPMRPPSVKVTNVNPPWGKCSLKCLGMRMILREDKDQHHRQRLLDFSLAPEPRLIIVGYYLTSSLKHLS